MHGPEFVFHQIDRCLPVTVDRALFLAIGFIGKVLVAIPGASRVTLTLGHIEVDAGKPWIAGQLAVFGKHFILGPMTLSSDNISGETIAVPDDQRARQAVASLGGHLFQATRAAIEWIQLADEATRTP